MNALQSSVFLGVDQAAKSGYCIVESGRVQASGVAKTAADIVAVVDLVQLHAANDWRRVLVALEDHSTHVYNANAKYKRNPATLIGMGEARGWWVHELARRGHPEPLRVLVGLDDWRMRVLGISNRAGGERCKAEAVRWAKQRALHELADDNEAEAVCIAHWASMDGLAHNEARKQKQRVADRGRRQAKKQLELPSALEAARRAIGHVP
jgi:ribosomal 50S subunit-recycling heat shock protein